MQINRCCFFLLQTVSEGLNEVLVLEDDVRFEPYFRFKLQIVLNELRHLKVPWDLVYVLNLSTFKM